MTDYNWCHGPECHKQHTQDRIRGVKGSKVLRTRKIKLNQWNKNHFFRFFCSKSCYNDFAHTHIRDIVAIAPRTEALETPILDPERTRHSNNYHSWYDTEIKVDETRSTDIG